MRRESGSGRTRSAALRWPAPATAKSTRVAAAGANRDEVHAVLAAARVAATTVAATAMKPMTGWKRRLGIGHAKLVGVAAGDHAAEGRSGGQSEHRPGGGDDDGVGEVVADDGAVAVTERLHHTDEGALVADDAAEHHGDRKTPASRISVGIE